MQVKHVKSGSSVWNIKVLTVGQCFFDLVFGSPHLIGLGIDKEELAHYQAPWDPEEVLLQHQLLYLFFEFRQLFCEIEFKNHVVSL
jgi:hypothetical protein